MLRRVGTVNSGEHVSQIHTYRASCYICAYSIQTIYTYYTYRLYRGELSTTEKPESIIRNKHGIDPFRIKENMFKTWLCLVIPSFLVFLGWRSNQGICLEHLQQAQPLSSNQIYIIMELRSWFKKCHLLITHQKSSCKASQISNTPTFTDPWRSGILNGLRPASIMENKKPLQVGFTQRKIVIKWEVTW